MQDQDYLDIVEIIQNRAKSNLSQIVFLSTIAVLIVGYCILVITQPDSSASYLVLLMVFGPILAFLVGCVVHHGNLFRTNKRNSKKLDISYIAFNRKYYIKGNRANQYIQTTNMAIDSAAVFNPMNLVNPTDLLSSGINVSLDAAAYSSVRSSADRAEYLEAKLVKYFMRTATPTSLPMPQAGTAPTLNPTAPQSISSLYPTPTKGVLSESVPLPAQPELTLQPASPPAQGITPTTPTQQPTMAPNQISGSKQIFYAGLVGLIFPFVFLIGAQMVIVTIGWGLIFVIYPAIAAAVCVYFWLQAKILEYINCESTYAISGVATSAQLAVHFGLLNHLHGTFLGLSDTIWRLLAISVGNALILAVLVAIAQRAASKTTP